MVENSQLDIEEIVRDSFDENETEQLAEKLDQLEPEEIAFALEAMPLEQRVGTTDFPNRHAVFRLQNPL